MSFKWVISIFRVREVIPCARFIMSTMYISHWIVLPLFLEICNHLKICLLRENLTFSFMIFLWWVLYIVNAIFLPILIKAKETMMTSGTAMTKRKVRTIFTISRKENSVASRTVKTFITVIRSKHDFSIETIVAVGRIAEVITIFEIINIETEITIFDMPSCIIIFWILQMKDGKWKKWSHFHKVIKLFKKWLIPVWVTSRIKTRPIITPPSLLTINNIGRIWMIHREHFFTS